MQASSLRAETYPPPCRPSWYSNDAKFCRSCSFFSSSAPSPLPQEFRMPLAPPIGPRHCAGVSICFTLRKGREQFLGNDVFDAVEIGAFRIVIEQYALCEIFIHLMKKMMCLHLHFRMVFHRMIAVQIISMGSTGLFGCRMLAPSSIVRAFALALLGSADPNVTRAEREGPRPKLCSIISDWLHRVILQETRAIKSEYQRRGINAQYPAAIRTRDATSQRHRQRFPRS